MNKTFKKYVDELANRYPKIRKTEIGSTVRHEHSDGIPGALSTFYVSKDADYIEHDKAHKSGSKI